MFTLTFIFSILLLIIGSIYFYIEGVPAISNFTINQLPKTIDNEVGNTLKNEIQKDNTPDNFSTEMLQEFYDELGFDNKTKIYVLKSNEFNAFAIPNNSIFVYNQLIYNVSSYEELAALLAHEYAHIKNRHGMKGIGQAISWELLGALISGDNNSENFIRNSNMLLTLKNSRWFETQADLDGLQLLREHQIDQKGMTKLFQTMLKIEGENKNETNSYLSTHPDTEERLTDAEEEIKKNPGIITQHKKLDSLFRLIRKSSIISN